MIQSFQEGIDIVLGVALGDPYSSSNLYLGNGFELLRQLSQEFSLRSRTEGSFIASAVAEQGFSRTG